MSNQRKFRFSNFILPTLFLILMITLTFSGCTLKEDLLGLPADPTEITKEAINNMIWKVVLGMVEAVGAIAGIFIIYGGIMYMTALGNEESLSKAKATLTWAVAGMVLIIFAYAIVKYVVAQIGYTLPEPIST